jgi:hypothetical protein
MGGSKETPQWTSGIVVDRADFFALASPPCEECGVSIQRVEMRWHLDEDGTWRPGAFMVCDNGHRVLVKPLL